MIIFDVITKLIKEKVIYISLTAVLILVSIFYYHCYVVEHIIFSDQQGKFTIISKCKAISVFTFTPYVSVRIKNFEVLTTAVNEGYDTLGDCMNSGIKRVEMQNDEKKIQIYTEDGKIKEIEIIYKPR